MFTKKLYLFLKYTNTNNIQLILLTLIAYLIANILLTNFIKLNLITLQYFWGNGLRITKNIEIFRLKLHLFSST